MDLLSAYRAFVSVVDHGGFSAGARAQGQSQTTLSRQVADLERHLGTKLLRRTTRRVSLTGDGEQLLDRARELIGLAGEAEKAVGKRAQNLEGHLRIAAPSAIGHVLVTPLLCSFLARHGSLQGEVITMPDKVSDLPLKATVDLVIEIGPGRPRLGERRKLGDVPRVLCATPMLVRDQGAPKTVDEIERMPAICMAPAGSEPEDWRLERGAEHRIMRPQTRLRCDNFEALRSAVLESAGIALAPLWLVQQEIASGRLWRLLPQWHGGLDPILAGGVGRKAPGKHARAFSDFLSYSSARLGIFA